MQIAAERSCDIGPTPCFNWVHILAVFGILFSRHLDGMEEGIPHQTSNEGRSQSVFKLQGNNVAVPGKVFNIILLNTLRPKDAVDPHLRDY